jgi:hypothetical protein
VSEGHIQAHHTLVRVTARRQFDIKTSHDINEAQQRPREKQKKIAMTGGAGTHLALPNGKDDMHAHDRKERARALDHAMMLWRTVCSVVATNSMSATKGESW